MMHDNRLWPYRRFVKSDSWRSNPANPFTELWTQRMYNQRTAATASDDSRRWHDPRHLENIFTYLTHRITSSVIEGLNEQIQWIK